MNSRNIIEQLENVYPLSCAAPWDNPGLLVGRRNKEVRRIYVAVDATERILDDAIEKGADLLLTHHPLLMSPLSKVNTDDFIGRRVVKLLQADLTYYAMHTNYDVVTMASLSASMLGLGETEILEVTREEGRNGEPEGFGRVGALPEKMSLRACGELVKQVFGLETVKLFGDPDRTVSRAAISPGSGKSMVKAALEKKAQVLISGDFGHHDGIDAVERGLAVIDAGHYGLEHIFVGQMAAFVSKIDPEAVVYQEQICNPFQVI